MKYTLEGPVINGSDKSETENLSFEIDMETGEMFVESEGTKLLITNRDANELVGVLRRKLAIYEEIEKSKNNFWARISNTKQAWDE